ncbi:hypothetical protein G3I61_28360 [Streptomyces diastaticus]|nr:hypothetical protein [Streptomyces diastaticus]
MAMTVDGEAWERWPNEVMTEADEVPWGMGDEPLSGDYSGLPWEEWKKPGQSWVAKYGEDFTDAHEFSVEVWRQAKASNLGVDVIVWSWEVVIFRFLDHSERTRWKMSGRLEPVADEDCWDLMADGESAPSRGGVGQV